MMRLPAPARWSVLLCCLGVSSSWAQPSEDVPQPPPDLEESYRERTQLQQVVGDSAIPPVRDRQFGPRIHVRAIRFEQLPVFPDQGITNEAVQQLAEKLRRRYSREDEVQAGGFTRTELEELAVQLDEIGARDNPDALTPERLDELVTTLRRQQQERGLSYGDLEEIANQITRFYRERGMILAKAYIPAQQVENGVVTFSVLEGRLGEVIVQGNKRYDADQLKAAFTAQQGEAVDSRAVEETLYLLNDFPGLTTYGFFSAGSEPGTTDLNLQVRQERPWRFALRGDNYGSRFTGDERLFAMFDWFNPLGIGDQLSVGWLQSRSPVNSELGIFEYSLPISARTRLSVSYDHNEFNLDDTDEALRLLDISGVNSNLAVGVDHQLVRSRARNLAVGASVTDKKTTLDALVELPNTDEHVRGLDLRLNADMLSDRYRLLNMAALTLQYGDFVNEVAAGRDDKFYKLALDTSSLKFMQLPFTDYDTRLLLRSRWHYTESALPAFEQLSLGGAQGVRAFTVSDFSADSAAQLSLEWYLPLPQRWNLEFAGTTLNDLIQVGLFTDAAYGVQNSFQVDENDKWVFLSGSGILFKFTWRDWFSSQLSFAVPSSSKSNLESVGDDAESVQTFLDFTWIVQ